MCKCEIQYGCSHTLGMVYADSRDSHTWQESFHQLKLSAKKHAERMWLYMAEGERKRVQPQKPICCLRRSHPLIWTRVYLDLCSQAQSPLLGNEFEYWYKQACLYLLPCCRKLEKRERMRDTYCLMSPREDASYTWSYARVKKTLP